MSLLDSQVLAFAGFAAILQWGAEHNRYSLDQWLQGGGRR